MSTRNVINVSDVEELIDKLAAETCNTHVQDWLRRNARRWIVKHYDHHDRIVRDPETGDIVRARANGTRLPIDGAPEWCETALSRGDEVIYLRVGPTLRKRISRVAQTLSVELDDGTLVSLDRLTFPQAEARARKRRRTDFIKASNERARQAAYSVYHSVTGDTIVCLPSKESLTVEGNRMSHCVGDYDYWVDRGVCEIYSVRDCDGKPKATIEVDESGEVWQIKGFANGAVDARYRPLVQAFIRHRGYPVEYDQDNLVTRRDSYATDADRLDSYLHERGGLDWIRANTFADYRTMTDASFGLLMMLIAANAKELSDHTVGELFEAFYPERGQCMKVWRVRTIHVYDETVTLYRVELPLPLLTQIYLGTFRRRPQAAQARSFHRTAEDAIARLALADPHRLFLLGPAREREEWEGKIVDSPVALLRQSEIDISVLREQRQLTLRRTLNEAKRLKRSRNSQPCDGHIYLRQLLDGKQRQYVL